MENNFTLSLAEKIVSLQPELLVAISPLTSSSVWANFGAASARAPSAHELMRDVKKLLKLQPGQDPSQALAKLQQDLAAFRQAQPTTDPSTDAPSTSSDAQTQLEQLLAQLQQLTGTPVSQPAPGADSSASSYSAPTQAPVAGLGGHHHCGHHTLKAVAAALQESPQELQAQLQSGQSVTDLAQAKGITDLPAAVAASIGAGKNTSLTDEQKQGLADAWLTDVQNTARTGAA